MTAPEVNYQAWTAAQNAFLASKRLTRAPRPERLKRRRIRVQRALCEDPQPAPPQRESAGFWQDWFGIWS